MTPHPGRPRDEAIEAKVLAAAVELLQERTDDFTMGDLVERSGVSRAAVYRRWPSRKDVVVAALDKNRTLPVLTPRATIPETLRDEFQGTIRDLGPDALNLLHQRLIQGLRDPDVQRLYWERHVSRRRSAVLELLRAGQIRGEVRDDVDLEVALDLINGAAYYQGVVRGDWASPAASARVSTAIDMVWESIRARS
ncbi:TetR/AcrR family transcriptional regulator [Zhihengliuella halotolerans]|uniref:TetR/AcrR family transcriptional regulator n=1 Tax=Zhihengliuella halotolerans TaxID=370736 RepID=UPI000C7FB504|nr:TetR/AcrR family transcriptional regulator [Zhihengliuella halotolerans]